MGKALPISPTVLEALDKVEEQPFELKNKCRKIMERAQDLIQQLMQEQVRSCSPLFFQRLKLIVVSNPGPGVSEV